jgi:dTDP-glucose 4,6-dehydratase
MTKTILLTGGAGFIGSHAVEHILKNTDFQITLLDRLSYAGNANRLVQMDCWEKEKSRVRFVYHDFRSPIVGKVADQVTGQGLDYIIHMGAETHVNRSIENAMPFATSNVIGTVNMLEFARAVKPERFIYISTDEVYGAVEGNKLHKEGEPHNPSNPYAASKAGAEDFCRSYFKTHGVPVIITNTMNNFGERQDVEKFVPKTIRAIYNVQPVTIHCRLDDNKKILEISSRCWLHARNHADALLFLLKYGRLGACYNVVGDRKDVFEIAEMISRIMDFQLEVNFEDFHSTRPGHDMHYGLDGMRMQELGWAPPFNLYDSMKHTVEWTLKHPEWL